MVASTLCQTKHLGKFSNLRLVWKCSKNNNERYKKTSLSKFSVHTHSVRMLYRPLFFFSSFPSMERLKLLLILFSVLFNAITLSSFELLVHDYYKEKCPLAEDIVRHNVEVAVFKDPRLAASVLRLHFHDCFVMVTFISSSFVMSFSFYMSMILCFNLYCLLLNSRGVMHRCFWTAWRAW